MPVNPPAQESRTQTITKVASRHAEVVIFLLGTLLGGAIAIVAGAVL